MAEQWSGEDENEFAAIEKKEEIGVRTIISKENNKQIVKIERK